MRVSRDEEGDRVIPTGSTGHAGVAPDGRGARARVARAGTTAPSRALRRTFLVQKAEYATFWLPRRVPRLHAVMTELFARDLRRLNDVLRTTTLDGHYWVWSGLLLGWAREGRILNHDDMDADFAVADADWERLEEAVPTLEGGGFLGVRRFRDERGATTELIFRRHGARFEFCRLRPDGDMMRYNIYGRYFGRAAAVEKLVPRCETETFTFLDREWRKVRDHERELSFMYGNWRVPDRHWSYMAPRADEVGRASWDPASSRW
jgi:hypothetical protein